MRIAFVLMVLLVALLNVPASWVALRVAQATDQKLLLTNSTGTLWRGSAEMVLSGGPDALGIFPGRVRWRLSPGVAGLDFTLEAVDASAMSGAISGTLGWSGGRLAPGSLMLPAQVLTGWGAPFNTLRLEGQLKLRWETFEWRYREAAPRSLATLTVEAEQLRSRLSPVAPLGQYRLQLALGPLGGKLDLETLSGPLMLSGQGSIVNGRMGFDGQATASDALEPQLIGLLSILGKREGGITRLHY